MHSEINTILEIRDIIAQHGQALVIGIAVIVVGLIAIKFINQGLKKGLNKLPLSPANANIVRHILCVLLLFLLVIIASVNVGMIATRIFELLIVVSMVAVGIIVVFRPLIPSLPFKVGNTVKIGDLLGKVEATTILHTRLRTFDGRTIFIPNRKIINDDVINFNFTPTRRFTLKVNIKSDQDLSKAKQTIEVVMVEDPRVLVSPRPVVYLMSLDKGYLELQGRGWADNLKRFVVTRELLEKTKFRLDQEGIALAMPQLQIHYSKENIVDQKKIDTPDISAGDLINKSVLS